MAFGIGSFFKSILPTVAPILGSAFGPIGTAVGTAIGAGFGQRGTAIGPSSVGPSVMTRGAGFDVTRRRVGTLGGMIVGAGISLVAELLRGSRERTGRPINVAKVIEAVKVCGIEQAAQIFDLTENEICIIVISKRRRRSRGISAVDLRRTRSTIRKVHNIAHDLKALAPPIRRHHR